MIDLSTGMQSLIDIDKSAGELKQPWRAPLLAMVVEMVLLILINRLLPVCTPNSLVHKWIRKHSSRFSTDMQFHFPKCIFFDPGDSAVRIHLLFVVWIT